MRVRFAPSPTGFLHIGNARTALFNFLMLQKEGGEYVLRVEDTDRERSKPEFTQQIYEDLSWLGIEWQEGPDKGGDFGPYLQSERSRLHLEYAEKLLHEGKAYHCYRTPEELEAMRKKRIDEGRNPKFDAECRLEDVAEIEKRKKEGMKPSVRFKVEAKNVVIKDLIRGEVTFDTDTIGDFIIVRPDGTPTFHLAVTVDDGLMKISHVLRGEDHLSNTPKHILLMEAMGFEIPTYAHMSLTMGPGGEPLSKRLGAMSIQEYRKLGYRSEALCNYMSLLGWSPGDDRELFSFDELKKTFSINRVTKSPSIFDKDKLDWVGGNHIRKLDDEVFLKEATDYALKTKILSEEDHKLKPEWYREVFLIFKESLSCYADLEDRLKVFSENFEYEDASVLKSEESKEVLNQCSLFLRKIEFLDEAHFDQLMKDVKKASKQKGKALFFPLRMALTGMLHGPELKHVMILLTKQGCLDRLEKALHG